VLVRIPPRSDSSYLLRITAAWCKKYDVPIEKIFSKTLLTKCARTLVFSLFRMTSRLTNFIPLLFAVPWAMEVDPDWKF